MTASSGVPAKQEQTGTPIGYHSRGCFAMAIPDAPSIRHTDCKAATLRILYGLDRQICGDRLTDSCYLISRRSRDFGRYP
jgi:hypothetical protein